MSFKTKQYNSFNRRSVIDLDTLSLDGKAKWKHKSVQGLTVLLEFPIYM